MVEILLGCIAAKRKELKAWRRDSIVLRLSLILQLSRFAFWYSNRAEERSNVSLEGGQCLASFCFILFPWKDRTSTARITRRWGFLKLGNAGILFFSVKNFYFPIFYSKSSLAAWKYFPQKQSSPKLVKVKLRPALHTSEGFVHRPKPKYNPLKI